MFAPTKFNRKSFGVEAVMVTADNIIEVAKWCGGVIKNATIPGITKPKSFIVINVLLAGKHEKASAFIGDWVTLSGPHFKVYGDKSFKSTFESIDVEKYQEVLHQVLDAMVYALQSKKKENLVPAAEKVAKEIAKLL